MRRGAGRSATTRSTRGREPRRSKHSARGRRVPSSWMRTPSSSSNRSCRDRAWPSRAAVKTDARYIGLLGSKRKTILIAQMLRGEGIPEERIRAVHAPVGLDLGGRTPAEIALSVLAELSLERYGGSGRPLRISDELF